MQDFRDFLAGLFKDLVLRDAKDYLADLNEYRLDREKGEYRTEEESQAIQNEVTSKADEMSKEFLDELNAKGVTTPDDLNEKQEIVKDTLTSYQKKFFNWLQQQ